VTTAYSVTGTDANGCQASDTVTVIVLPVPLVLVQQSPAGAICQGDSVALSVSSAVSYLWSTGDTTQTVIIQPSTISAYWVIGTDANGCQDSDSVTVTVNPLPIVDAGVDQTVCEGQQAQLAATGAMTYTWQPGTMNGQTVTVTPTSTATYTVTGTDANGCEGTDSVTVTVIPAPVVLAQQAPTGPICEGESVTLSAGGALTYDWNPGGPGASIVVTPGATMGYLVTGTDANGCTDTATVVVTVNPLPIVDLGPDRDLCVGQQAQLAATGASSYLWSTGETTSSINVQPPTSTSYSVTGTDANGCSNADTVVVNVHQLPVVDAGADQNICQGDNITLSATGASSYLWTPGGNGQSIVVAPTSTTTYLVTGTDTWGCEDDDDMTVNVFADPIVSAMPSEICAGEQALLTASGAITYSWQPGGMTGDSVTVTPLVTTTYTVTGMDVNGCENASTVVVTVLTDCPKAEPIIKIPTAFTPNADGLNDIFRIEESQNFTLTSLRIYNRWGEVIFEALDIMEGWDGTCRGMEQAIGAYAYLMTGTDVSGGAVSLRGNVTLVR
jgi:gliding motility-associated-like protein